MGDKKYTQKAEMLPVERLPCVKTRDVHEMCTLESSHVILSTNETSSIHI